MITPEEKLKINTARIELNTTPIQLVSRDWLELFFKDICNYLEYLNETELKKVIEIAKYLKKTD